MRRTLGWATFLMLLSVSAYAEVPDAPDAPKVPSPIHAKSLEIGGATSFLFNRETVSSGTGAGATSSNFNVAVVDGSVTYYLTDRIGVGGFLGYLKFSIPASSGGGGLSYTTAGGHVKIRFPLAPKTDFYVLGSGGIDRAVFSGTPNSGTFFSAGAGTDVFLADNAAMSFGVTFAHTSLNHTGLSGLAVAAGFSIYLR